MANNLIVEAGNIVSLEESMPIDFPVQPERLLIDKLEDFVNFGIIKSSDTLDRLLDTAKIVTEEKLRNPLTHTPFVPIRGTSRPDLRRFGAFASNVQDISSSEVNSFWRITRTIDPNILSAIDTSTRLVDVVQVDPRLWETFRYLFQDITVQEGATLSVSRKVHNIRCNDLLIKRSGRILINGGGSLFITAESIRGEQ